MPLYGEREVPTFRRGADALSDAHAFGSFRPAAKGCLTPPAEAEAEAPTRAEAPPIARAVASPTPKKLLFGLFVAFTLLGALLFASTIAPKTPFAVDYEVLRAVVRLRNSTRAFRTRAGLLITPPPFSETAAANRSETLARFVHQSWKTAKLPARFSRWSRTWHDCFPNWTHVLWSDEDNERFVREHYSWFLQRYLTFRQHIYRVDAVRYMYLHRFGGVYTDLDNLCLRPFEHLLRGRGLVFGDMEAAWWFPRHFMYIQNSWMYSRPGHPFWIDLLQAILRVPADESGRAEDVTGPRKLMNVLKERWPLYANETTVYPPHVMNPFSWSTRRNTPCKDLNQMTDEELSACVAHHRADPETVVLQLHTQTWGAGRILRRRR